MLPVSADHRFYFYHFVSQPNFLNEENDYPLLCQSESLEELFKVRSTSVCFLLWPNESRQNFPLLDITRARDNSDCTVGGLY